VGKGCEGRSGTQKVKKTPHGAREQPRERERDGRGVSEKGGENVEQALFNVSILLLFCLPLSIHYSSSTIHCAILKKLIFIRKKQKAHSKHVSKLPFEAK